jgi:hypothetical protein
VTNLAASTDVELEQRLHALQRERRIVLERVRTEAELINAELTARARAKKAGVPVEAIRAAGFDAGGGMGRAGG